MVAHGDSPRRKTFTIPLLSVVVVARPPGSSTVLLGARPGCRFGPIGSTTITHITNTPGAYPTTKFIYFVFSSRGSERTPAFLPLLLILSGDIETNPGPYPCPTCSHPYNRRTGAIQCPSCKSWTHYNKRCSGVQQRHNIPDGWLCLRCHPTHNMTQHPPISPPPLGTAGLLSPPPLSPPPTPPPVVSPPASFHPPSPPTTNTARATPPQQHLRVLQLNIDSITSKFQELRGLLRDSKIHIAVIQETKLKSKNHTPKFPGYTTIRHDRQRGEGGGLITLIHKDVPFTNTTAHTISHMPLDHTLEIQTHRVRIHKQDITIANIYIPPSSSSPQGYVPQLDYLNSLETTLILGDPNAHHDAWLRTQQTDTRGEAITDQLPAYAILNDPYRPTRKPYNINTRPTSPDVSLATYDIATRITWQTLHHLSSDHLPILITYTLSTPFIKKPKHTYINYKRASWDTFTATIETTLQDFRITDYNCIDKAVQHINNTITQASKDTIPAGTIRQYNPSYSRAIKHKIQTRNHLRKQTPTTDILNRIQTLNTEITEDIKQEQSNKWKQILDTVTFNANSSKLWKLIRGLNNKYTDAPQTHEAILQNTHAKIPTDTEQANLLNKHYANISSLPSRQEDRVILKQLHKITLDSHLHPPFTTNMTLEAIRRTKNTSSTGPDGISYLHLKHLGPHAIRALTDIFNLSITQNTIPNIWKLAKIIPILKPNKPPTEPASYRPISLLCNPSKILERLVLNNISAHIPLAPSQHGFRSQHSTSTLLTNMTQTILEGLNTPKPAYRSLVAAIDISKAFDTVPRHLLIGKIINTDIHPNFKKWLANFLSGRHGYTIHNGKPSRTRHYTNGVPQGSVLSPTLFNLFTHDIPVPTQNNTHLWSYADDLTIISQHPKHETAAVQLQSYIHTLENWLTTNRLKVSANKSALTLITPWTMEYADKPRVTLHNTPLPVTENTNILGVTYDRGMTFKHHIENINTKAKTRLNVIRALTHTEYGHSKEDTTTLYKQYIRPILTYAHTAWQPDTANTHLGKLQTTQNTALRLATGCTRTTPIQHIHEESLVLPLISHMDMRGTHAYSSTIDPSHPLHFMQTPANTGRQHIHRTPARHYNTLYTSLPPRPEGTSERKHIHTVFTQRALSSSSPNSLLQALPPPVASEERTLGRDARVHLSRLRCGHHPALPTYMHRIGRADDDLCHLCGQGPADVAHVLLHCPTTQQHRDTYHIHSLEDLWTRPVDCYGFLSTADVLQRPPTH